MDLITTPFGRNSTAAEVVQDIDLTGKRAIVTGGASGIGIETTRALAKAGAEVTVAVRNTNAAEDIVRDISSATGNIDLKIAELDLTDLASVKTFARSWFGPLDILINNAGIMAYPELELASGHELQFATNHLGHFALTVWLHDALKQAGNARVVSVSSSAHQRSPVIFDDINFLFRAYDPFLAYGQSKTANILFSVAASEVWAADGITSNALMPGSIPSKLEQYIGGPLPATDKSKTPEQGAATSVLLAVSPLLEGIGGRYFVDCNETYVAERRTTDMTGVAPFAVNRDNAMRLWEYSLKAIS